jgi:sulfite oxidase
MTFQTSVAPLREEKHTRLTVAMRGEQPPEYQLKPLPETNPLLTGERFKQYHYAVGLNDIPDISWQYVLKEKAPDMIHVLQFPYNGEPPRVGASLLWVMLGAQTCR